MEKELFTLIEKLISDEHRMSIVEAEHMSVFQSRGLPGFKRQHRYLARWRTEAALKLRCWVTDKTGMRPFVSVSITSSVVSESALDCIISLIGEYDTLMKNYVVAAKMAGDKGHDDLLQILEYQICWLSKTIMKYRRDYQEISNVNSDSVYIQLRSESHHEKFKKKEADFRICAE
jgi:hypothetical protein